MVSKDLGSLHGGTRGQVLENLSTMVNMVVYLTELGKSVMVNSNMGPWSLYLDIRERVPSGGLMGNSPDWMLH